MLAALGLSPAEEEIYRLLVRLPGADADELAGRSTLPPAEIERVLHALAARGLILHETTGFTAAPPAAALGALLRQQRDDLRSAELDLMALVDEHRSVARRQGGPQVVEVITDIEAVRHRFAQIQEAARSDIRSIVVPNLQIVPARQNTSLSTGLRRGVRYRVILDRRALSEPDMPADLESAIAEGEEIRLSDTVPIKMMIADRDHAMLPLTGDQPGAPASILVHACGILDALIVMFEYAWEKAHPVGRGRFAHQPELSAIDAVSMRAIGNRTIASSPSTRPCGSRLFSTMLPFSERTISWQIASPRPEPRTEGAAPASAANGSKSCLRCCAEMPGPLSATVSAA